jgi:phosphopantetheine adenylyltransferase
LVSLSAITYNDYIEKKKKEYIFNFKYHEEHLIKEIDLIKQRNKWIEDLYNSL